MTNRQVQDAKARFSELLDTALRKGPQVCLAALCRARPYSGRWQSASRQAATHSPRPRRDDKGSPPDAAPVPPYELVI